MKFSIFNRRTFAHFDWALILMILPIMAMSFFLIREININLAYKQGGYIAVAFCLFIIAFLLPIRRLYWAIPFAYWFGVGLLALVDIVGVTRMGAQRWLELPFFGLTFQPSEIFKPCFILMLAYLIRESPPSKGGYEWRTFFKLLFYIAVPFALIMKEPDLGTAFLLALIGGGVMIAVGLQRKIWVTFALVLSLSGGFFYFVGYDMLPDYQKKRIEDFLSENDSYHARQSLIAIGNGGISGKQPEEATQTQLRFLPIAASDFIFAYFAERFGFAGALLLIALYAMIVLHLFSLNSKARGDYFTMVTITATAIMIFLYMAVNIAMTTRLAPVVGVPLPLFSHGGSSFVNFIVMFAIIENLLAFRFDFLYTSAPRSLDR
ncbi:MAG: rod shape-determining protein RodA [Helicobacteraceae bacterium]|jgi:rod shape determining protein RodA|nr:rod shape-determining protein RodA [Helicobacteraceae bacterium]